MKNFKLGTNVAYYNENALSHEQYGEGKVVNVIENHVVVKPNNQQSFVYPHFEDVFANSSIDEMKKVIRQREVDKHEVLKAKLVGDNELATLQNVIQYLVQDKVCLYGDEYTDNIPQNVIEEIARSLDLAN